MIQNKVLHVEAEVPTPRHHWLTQWLFDPFAYQAEELKMREQILLLRQSSGLDPRLLETHHP